MSDIILFSLNFKILSQFRGKQLLSRFNDKEVYNHEQFDLQK